MKSLNFKKQENRFQDVNFITNSNLFLEMYTDRLLIKFINLIFFIKLII